MPDAVFDRSASPARSGDTLLLWWQARQWSGYGYSERWMPRRTPTRKRLLSRLRLIEDQPLETRAVAFAQVHDELKAVLDAGDSSRSHG